MREPTHAFSSSLFVLVPAVANPERTAVRRACRAPVSGANHNSAWEKRQRCPKFLITVRPPTFIPQSLIPAVWSWSEPSKRPDWEMAVNVDMIMNMEILLWAAENGGSSEEYQTAAEE